MSETQVRLHEIIVSILKEIGTVYNVKTFKRIDGTTPIYQSDGTGLDSLMFVRFIADLEQRLSQKWGREIVLTNDDLLNATGTAFETVNSLVTTLGSWQALQD